ncbi:MAG: PD40 domain-containing protein [Acidobacteria bacterium]|nr:PD40 domain-containing protein [Acidobacteriota bacterium]
MRIWIAVLLAGIPLAFGAGPWRITERANLSSSGAQDNGGAGYTDISADGRFVALLSDGSNLVPGDTNGFRDVFVRDRRTGQTTRVSVASNGSEANDNTYFPPSLSADGRFVAFASRASNLVPGDTNGQEDVFVHDRATGQTTRVSVSSSGAQGNSSSTGGAISADGRFVAFLSTATNLVPGDTNGAQDAFLHDRLTGETTRVSIAPSGGQFNQGASSGVSISGDGQVVAFTQNENNDHILYVRDLQTGQTDLVTVGYNGLPVTPFVGASVEGISGDGRLIVFSAWGSNLVPGDTNNTGDVFVHDRLTRQTGRVSVASDGSQGNAQSGGAAISGDGRFVVFASYASNLVGTFLPRQTGSPICIQGCDTNNGADFFVHNLQSGQTTLVSETLDGRPPFPNTQPSINQNGQYIAFGAAGANLVPGDTNQKVDIFIAGPPRFVQPGPPGTNFSPPTALKRVVNPPAGGTVQAGETIDYRIEVTATSPVNVPVVVTDMPLNGTVTVLGTSPAFAGCTGAAIVTTGCTAPSMPIGTEFIAVHFTVGQNCKPAGNSATVSWGGTPLAVTNPIDFAADTAIPQCVPFPWHTIDRTSVSSAGNQGDDLSDNPAISRDGRFVTFRSVATNLVPGDTNNAADIILRDRKLRQTSRVSVSSTGVQGNFDSLFSSVNRDGTVVAFDSAASTLVPNDTVFCGVPNCQDVFVRDVPGGQTSMASVDPNGNGGLGNSVWPSLSADGRMMSFVSAAGNLAPNDTNGIGDVFVRDLVAGQTTRVSLSSTGAEMNSAAKLWSQSKISADGRYVAFASDATTLVTGKTNGVMDIFVHDRLTAQTVRVSLAQNGAQANGNSTNLGISGNGRYIVFQSAASNLVPGDTNGQEDIFVHDRDNDGNGIFDEPGGVWIERVSLATGGVEGNGRSREPSISDDGRFVAFQSDASNLVPNDTNGIRDAFVRDRQTGQTLRVTAWDGSQPNNVSVFTPQLSGDGCYLAYTSRSTNLLPTPPAVLLVQEVYVASRCE